MTKVMPKMKATKKMQTMPKTEMIPKLKKIPKIKMKSYLQMEALRRKTRTTIGKSKRMMINVISTTIVMILSKIMQKKPKNQVKMHQRAFLELMFVLRNEAIFCMKHILTILGAF